MPTSTGLFARAVRRMAELAAMLLVSLAVPGQAAADPPELADMVAANRALQYGLIAAGALNAPADPGNALRDDPARPTPLGTVRKEQIKKAIGLFATVYGAPDVSSEAAMHGAMEHILGFDQSLRTALEIEAVMPIEGQQILVPRLLVAEKIDTEPLEKMFESPNSGIQIYTFKWPLRGNPPLEFLRTTLSRVSNARIRSISHSNHGFNVTISDRILRSGATRHHQKMAFAADGTIRGLYVRYSDSPTKEFVQPEFLAPLRAHWTPPADVLAPADQNSRLAALETWLEGREIGEEQRDQLKELVKNDEQAGDPAALQALLDRWTWRHAMRAMAWIIHDEFEAGTRWRSSDISNCFVEPEGGPPGTHAVRIVYATNRAALDGAGKPETAPGNWYDIAAEEGNALNVGCASVAVPKDLGADIPLTIEPRRTPVPGEADTPRFSLLKSSLPTRVPAQRSDHELQILDRESWRYQREDLALVLVHGYHTSFEEALLRAARIAAATKYKGRVFLFSWPSASSAIKYMIDMDGAERSELHLTGFLRAILRNPEVKRLDVVAHSMGSQLLLRSLGDLRDVFYVRDDVRLGQVIFAASDLSKDVFDEKIRETVALADAVTIYAADNDKPLKLSSYLRGGNERLGLIGDRGSHRAPSTNVVDASTRPSLCNGWNLTHLEHSYFVDNPVTLRHIATVLSRSGRGVRPGETNPFDETFVTKLADGQFQLKQDDAECWWKPW